MSQIIKINDFNSLKKANITYLRMLMDHSGYKSSKAMDRISECGNYLDLLLDSSGTSFKVERGSYCHDRWCPVCYSRRMYRNMIELETLTNFLSKDPDKDFLPISDQPLFKELYDKYGYHKYRFVWITITVRNVDSGNLYECVRRINKSWKRLYSRKQFFNGCCYGFYAVPECTYNPDKDSYHPHLHVLVAVRNSYFNKHNMMTHGQLLQMWKDCYKDPELNNYAVDIRAVKDPRYAAFNMQEFKKNDLATIDQYMTKVDISYLYSWEVFKTISEAYAGLQEYHCSGVFRMAAMLYDADLLSEYLPVEETVYIYRCSVRFNPNMMQYQIDPGTFIDVRTGQQAEPPPAARLVLLI